MTTFYIKDRPAPYTPTTFKGAWDDTAVAVTRLIDSTPEGGGVITSVSRAETSLTDEWDVLLYRGVSGPLAAQTISGTLNVMLGVCEPSSAANFHYHLHIYVTQGDTNTPRGTLLTDYREAAGVNEWPVSSTGVGRALNAAQTLTSLAINAGDRIVVEIGFASRNVVATSYAGALNYGTAGLLGNSTDLAAGGDGTSNRGFLTFSATLIELTASLTTRTTQATVEVLRDGSLTAPTRLTQITTEVLRNSAASPRLTQIAVEVLEQLPTKARQSQEVVEVLRTGLPLARQSQEVVEVLRSGTPLVRQSQQVVEVLRSRIRPPIITLVGSNIAAANSIALPAHQPGDLILISIDWTITPAAGGTVPNWITLQSDSMNPWGVKTSYAIATASDHTSGVWTSASRIGVLVFRGVGAILAIGGSSALTGGGTLINYPALILQRTDDTSCGVRVCSHHTIGGAGTPSGSNAWIKQVEITGSANYMGLFTSPSLLYDITQDTVSNINTNFLTHTIEVTATPLAGGPVTVTPAPATLTLTTFPPTVLVGAGGGSPGGGRVIGSSVIGSPKSGIIG